MFSAKNIGPINQYNLSSVHGDLRKIIEGDAKTERLHPPSKILLIN